MTILLSVMSSGNVNTREAVTINQAKFASPMFELLAHQWFCEKPFEVWATKDCGRSSVMHPPGDLRGYSVLWVSSTEKCVSLKQVFHWWILMTAAVSQLNYEINTREQWQKIKVIECCRESYRNTKYCLYRNGLLILQLYFKDNALNKRIKAIVEKILSEIRPVRQSFSNWTFFNSVNLRLPCHIW